MTDLVEYKNDFLEYNEVGLSVKRIITWEEAKAKTVTFDGLEFVVQFYIGDWLNAMEQQFGEKYAQLIPEGKESSWRVYKWVATGVKPENRHRNLKWSYHMVVAGLISERQIYLLNQAEAEKWNVNDLRMQIKGEPVKKPKLVKCPNCGTQFDIHQTKEE